MIRLGILGSTRGTTMLALIDAIKQNKLSASIEIVISNKPEALILKHAAINGIPYQCIEAQDMPRNWYDQKISNIFREHYVDLILLIGYMRILSNEFVATWEKKLINIHPSLLPDFAGKMDLEVHRDVIAAGKDTTGCTVHYVTEKVDAGPIILQKTCEVFPTDTPLSLKERVQQLEGQALIESIRSIVKS